LGRRSLEFRHEQAETLALIAGLSVYQPRARTLFIQAVSICEEVVANNASHSNKNSLFTVLSRAGSWISDPLCTQWLGQAVQLMTQELPPTMVPPEHRGTIYNNYGIGLQQLKQYANAMEAYYKAISTLRSLAIHNPVKHNYYLGVSLMNVGVTLTMLGKCGDAIGAYKEALELGRAMSAQRPLQYNLLMARTLDNYAATLGRLSQVAAAAEVAKEAISHFRNIAQTGEEYTGLLCGALRKYGYACYLLGQHAEAVLAYQESIPLQHAIATADSEEEGNLRISLHNIANSFHALDKHAEANVAGFEALERNHWRVLITCNYAPDFRSCFVCQNAMTLDSTTPP